MVARRKTEQAPDRSAQVLKAAERCIKRHGIRKTTIEDIAVEAGMSRPSVYRYFADRDALLVALVSEHSRALLHKAHQFIAQHDDFRIQLSSGLIYLAEHGRRDPFTRHLLGLDGLDLSQTLAMAHASELLTAEFWDPFLDAAEENGTLRPGIVRADAHLWLGNVGLMLMRMLEEDNQGIDRYREMVEAFVVPAFVA